MTRLPAFNDGFDSVLKAAQVRKLDPGAELAARTFSQVFRNGELLPVPLMSVSSNFKVGKDIKFKNHLACFLILGA